MRDLLNNTKQVISVAAQSIADPNTVNGLGVDTVGFGADVMEVTLGSKAAGATGGTVTAKIQESSDNVTFTDVIGATASYSGATGGNRVLRVAYTGTRRYMRAVVTNSLTGGAAGTNTIIAAANFLLGHPRFAPVVQS